MIRIRALVCLAACTLTLCTAALAASPPSVDTRIDPAKSFWDDHVHYPFPHQFARVQDTQGVSRELAYVDLYRGSPGKLAKAPVLVLIHGRTMHSGYWGSLIDAPLAAGYRVISIDWSNTGKSLRPNLDKPLTRTLDDVRRMIHSLVTGHLKIAKANYLGHSLGGQIVAGYLLDYPEAVERAVLYAPGGMELFKGSTPRLIQKLAYNDRWFNLLWATGTLPDIGESEDRILAKFYSTRRPDTKPYLQAGDKLGEFMVATHALALKGNPVELERFRKTHAWDSLSSLAECGADDPRALRHRFIHLKVPTLMVYGLQDPAFPVPGSGNERLREDIIEPLAAAAAREQAPLQIKFYENAGHFLHTDIPEQFSHDVLSFLRTGKIP